MRVACAAARQSQVHRRRVQACAQGKKSQAGSIGSRRTIKNSRRKCAGNVDQVSARAASERPPREEEGDALLACVI